MDGTPETRRARARQVGMLLQGYRRAHRGEGQGGRLSQEGVLKLMGAVDARYLDSYDRSTVARWESGEILPNRERLDVFGKALNLSAVEIEGLIALAGLDDDRAQIVAGASAVSVKEVAAALPEYPAPAGVAGLLEPMSRSYSGEMTRFVLSRFLLPGLGIAGGGYLLASVGWSADWMLTAYISVVTAAVLTQYFLRLRRSNGIRELLFVSIFVLLSAPMLQAPLTRMDVYGFYTVEGFANTPMPFLLALLANLLLALAAGLMFDFLWRWQYSRQGVNPYLRAAWVTLPPLAFVYVCGLVFSYAATWIYLLEVFPVLGGVLMAILVLREESIRLEKWVKQTLIQTSLAITIVLTAVGLSGMVVVYWDPSLLFVPDHTLIRSWEVDFNALGYPPEEFPDRARIGVIWAALAAIIYMVVVIGGGLIVTICRKGTGDSADPAPAPAPAAAVPAIRRRRTKGPRVDVRHRPGWLAGHRILPPIRSNAGLVTVHHIVNDS